jgi:formate dehydrogenase major subunit
MLYSDKEYLGLQWPCPSADHPGTPILLADEEWVANSRPVEFFKGTEDGSDDFPLLLVPGRVLLQSERDVQIEEGRQNRIVREEFVELSQIDADALGLRDGDAVEVVTARTA